MAGTEYTYKITLDGSQAVADAKVFKKQLETELSKITLKAKLDVGAIEADMGKAKESAKKAADAVTKGYQSSMKAFERDVGRLAPQTFLAPMEGALQKGLVKPAQESTNAINALREQVKLADRAVKEMGVGIDRWFNASSIDKWGIALQAAQRRVWGIRGMGYQVQAYGRGIMAGGLAGLGGAAAAAKEYISYSEPLGRAARNLELNAKMADELDDKLRRMAGTMSIFSPQEQAQQLYLWAAATGEVVDSTADMNAMLQRTASVQKLAALGMIDQAEAVEAVTDIQSQYQMSVDDTAKIVAMMVKVAAVSKAEVADLAYAFRYAGARADAANTSFEETAATLQILSAFGMRGSMAGRGLARLFENLIAPSDAARAVLDELFQETLGRDARQVFTNAEGQFIGLADAIDVMAEATANLTEMERQEFVAKITTQNAARVLIPLLELQVQARERNIDVIQAQQNILEGVVGEHEQAFISMMEDIYGYQISTKSATDTMNDQWEQFLDSVDGRTKRLKAEFSGAMTTIGESVVRYALPKVEDLVDGLANFVKQASQAEDFGETVVKIFRDIAILGAGIFVAGKGISIYADIKAIAMAATMKKAADEQVGAAATMLRAAQLQLGAAGKGVIPGKKIPTSVPTPVPTGPPIDPNAAPAPGTWLTRLFGVTTILAILNELVNVSAREAEGRLEYTKMLREERMTEKERQQLFGTGEWVTGKFPRPDYWQQTEKGMFPELPDWGTALHDWEGAVVTVEQLRNALEEIRTKNVDVERSIEASNARWVAMGHAIQGNQSQLNHFYMMTGDLSFGFESARLAIYGMKTELIDIRTILGNINAAIGGVISAFEGIVDKATRWKGIIDAMDVMRGHPEAEDFAQQVESAASGGWGLIQGMADIYSPAELYKMGENYILGIQQIYTRLRDAEQWQIDLEVDAYRRGWEERFDATRENLRKIEQAQEAYYQKAKQAREDFATTIADIALTKTAVTEEDVWATSMGIYEEKPDEWVRQLRAAAKGEEEWKGLIPEDIWAAGQPEVARWVQGEEEAFYAGLRPGKVNWDAVKREIEKRAAEKQGREMLMERGVEEMAKRGIDLTREDIAALFGLETPLQQMFMGGKTPSEVGQELNVAVGAAMQEIKFDEDTLTATGASFVGTFSGSVNTELVAVPWALMFANAWYLSVKNNTGALEGLGKVIVPSIVKGIEEEIGAVSLVNLIVAICIKKIREALD